MKRLFVVIVWVLLFVLPAITAGAAQLTDNGNGTLTDNNTGLMWQKCSIGQNNDSTCSGTALEYNWYQASGTYNAKNNPTSQNVCRSLILSGHSDWRLPSSEELESLVDRSIPWGRLNPNASYFPGNKSAYHWSSTTSSEFPDQARNLHIYSGMDSSVNDKFSSKYVRCVRGGQ